MRQKRDLLSVYRANMVAVAVVVVAYSMVANQASAWVPSTSRQSASAIIRTRARSLTAFSLIKNAPRMSAEGGADGGGDNEMTAAMGLNELQTLLREAVNVEDYLEAKRLRDVLADRVSSGAYKPTGEDSDADKRKMKRLSWRGLGTAPWLEDRLDALGYKFPTTIQINAFESINCMLGALEDVEFDSGDGDGGAVTSATELFGDETLEELLAGSRFNMGVVVSGSTGSGKTLSYLVPTLSTLSESLFTRQRIRIKAEEDIGDAADDLLARVAVQTSPAIRGQGRKQVGGSGVIATGASLSSLGKSGTDVRSPLALIVVPTRELGVQTALLLYECIGGSTKKTMTQLSGTANMFKYKGPKGVKIGCILDKEEAKYGLKLQTDVAITTPEFLGKLIRDGDIIPSKLRVVIYDEADLALERTTDDDLNALFRDTESERDFSRLTYLVGASVTESLGQLAVKDSILPVGKSFIATATRFAPLSSEDSVTEASGMKIDSDRVNGASFASLKDLGFCLDPGLRHERMVAPSDTGMLCLARMLRKELKGYEDAIASGTNTTKVQRPRVVVFLPGEEEARAAVTPMRDALWGGHKLCVLLPNIGNSPLEIMEQFKAGETSVMLATPNSVRGLDFANLTHVFTLYLPADDPREYLHLAGRVGRIGQMGSVAGSGGRVTSILRPDEADQMEELAKELNFEFIDLDYETSGFDLSGDEEADLEESDVEDLRRYLEDTITLLDTTDDQEVDLDAYEARRATAVDLIDDEEEDDDDEAGGGPTKSEGGTV